MVVVMVAVIPSGCDACKPVTTKQGAHTSTATATARFPAQLSGSSALSTDRSSEPAASRLLMITW